MLRLRFLAFIVGVITVGVVGEWVITIMIHAKASPSTPARVSLTSPNVSQFEIVVTPLNTPLSTVLGLETSSATPIITTTIPTLVSAPVFTPPLQSWPGPLIPLTLGGVHLMASVADTEASREQGLSGTITLPPTVVKLFVFDHNDRWSFWMKDMHYPIDIIWLNENHQVVYLVPNVTPDSYPETFIPPLPARYVIETAAGLSATHHIIPGTLVAF